MKKINGLVIVLMAVMFIFVGCGNGNTDSDKAINLDEVYNKAIETADFQGEYVEVDNDIITNLYTEINLDDVSKYKVIVNATGAKAEELALFEAKDADAAERILGAINERLEDLKFGFKDYIPKEYQVLENAVIRNSGKYIFFVTGDNCDKVSKVFDEYIK